jgi:hypothetical protein
MKMLNHYKNYHDHNFQDEKVLLVEKVDSFKLNDAIDFHVKIDKVIEYKGNIFVVDYKTSTSKNRSRFFDSFDPSMQVSAYCYYCKQKFGRCAGFIPIALFMGYRKNKYKDEPAGFWCKFEHHIINRNDEQLQDFIDNLKAWYKKLNHSILHDEFPKNESNCTSYKGCGFKDLCIACDDEQVQEMIYEEYDPYEYLKKDEKEETNE